MTILWALHVQGPDDVYAAPSWAAAAEAAAWFEHQFTQRRILKEPDLPAVAFAAVPWTHSAESHAKELPRWSEVYPGMQAPPSAPEWKRDDDATFDCLHLVGESEGVTLDHVRGWTDDECKQAELWAGAIHLKASDNDDIEVPPMPECVRAALGRAAT